MSNTKVYSAEVKLELQGIKEVLVDIKKLQTELNSVVKDIKKAFTTRIDSAPVREFSQSVSQSTEKVKAHAEAVKQMAEADKEAANAKKKSQEATANFNEAMRRFDTQISKSDSRTDVAGIQGITQGIATAKQGLFEIKAQLKTGISFESLYGVYDTVNKTLAQVNQSTNQVRMGLNIAFADAGKDVNKFGQAAEGLKVALFGVDTAGKQYSGTLGWIKKGLEAVSASTISLSRNTNTLGADAVETARKMADLNNRLGAGFDNLKNAMQDAGITRMGVQMGRLKEIANQTAAEFSNLASNISSGKKIDTGVLKSYERGVIELQRSLKQLDDLGVIPTTKALKDLEHQMETTADDELKAELAQQLAKMKQLKAAYDETKTVIQSNSEGVRALNIQVKAYTQGSEGFVSRLKQMWSGSSKDTDVAKKGIKGVTDVLYSGETSADGMTKKVGLLGGALQGASKSASIFKDVMLGTFAGNLLSNAIGGITGMIGNVVSQITGFGSSLAGEFFRANRQVQDFDTTLRQMMTGFDPDVIKKSMQATNEFIRKIIATTPFELATGQQAFQQLATAGFDPRAWLKESADAAAAFNKPMEQLIFAMQRLKAGSKGMGVDMLRDFGIPVQQVGVWTNQASGKVAEFNEVAGKTEEELKASGYAFKKWEFEANGALKQTPTEALDILNGYFRQNAVVVDASAARSKTLTGVLSNLKDTFTTLLTAFGQPIFKVVTQVLTDVYDVIANLMDVLQPFAQLIGEQVAAAFQGWWSALTGIQPVIEGVSEKARELAEAVRSERIKQIGAAIMQYLKPALFAVMAIMKGDWSKAWGLFYQLAVKAVKGIGTFLQTTGKDALKWGASFVGMIAKGLVTAASTTLKFAIKSVATTISNFMKPGSPPREGPLSTIDKWGQGLIKTFGEGFSSADFSFMQDVLSPVKDMFLSMGKTDAYKQVRGMVGSLIQGINETGTLNEQIWAGVEAKLGSTNKELAAYIRAELQLKQVSTEYQKAEKNGFVSKELQDRVDAAQTLVALRKEDLELANQAKQGSGGGTGPDGAQNLKADLDKQKKIAENEYKAGITSKAEYYAKLAELDKGYAQQLAEQGDIAGAKKANEQSKQEQKKTLKESFDEEKKFLEQKKKVGLVTEEEYLSELQGLNKKYGEEALKAGDTGMAQELSNKAKDLEKQIQKARLEEQRKQLDAQVKQEREILEKKYAAGLISEEEYRQGLVQIQENYVNQLMQAGAGPAVLDKEISKLKAMKEELKAFQTPKQDNIQTILGDMANDVTGEFDKMLESLKGEFDSAATSTWENVKQTFFDTFTPIWNDITASISESLGGLGGDGKLDIMGGIKQQLSELWVWFTGEGGPLSQGTQLFDSITTSLDEWRSDPSNQSKFEGYGAWIAESLIKGIKTSIGLSADAIGNETVQAFIVGVLKNAQAWVNTWVTMTRESLTGFTTGIMEWINGGELNIYGQSIARTLVLGITNSLLTTVNPFWGILTQAQDLINQIGGVFSSLDGDSLVGRFIESIIGMFTRLYDTLVGHSIIPDLVNEIVDILGSLPDRLAELGIGETITGFFTGMADGMLESGRSLINNFVSGVKEVLPSLQSFMETEVAGYSISDLFPHSPARRGPLSVLPNWQYYMTEGLAPAVESVNQTLAQVSNSIVQTTQQAAEAIQETAQTMQDSIAMATSTYPSASGSSSASSSKKKKNGLSYGYSDKYSKENQGSGFGNYGKGQDGPGWTKQKGGLTNAWKNFFNSYKGKTPQYAKGSLKIATTHTAVVHKGEAVLPAPVADSMRKAFEKTGGKGLAGLSIGSAVFPNVRDGRDAQDFLNELNKRVHRAKLRGSTV